MKGQLPAVGLMKQLTQAVTTAFILTYVVEARCSLAVYKGAHTCGALFSVSAAFMEEAARYAATEDSRAGGWQQGVSYTAGAGDAAVHKW